MNPNTPQIDDLLLFLGQMATALLAISGALMLLGKLVWGRLSKRLDELDEKANHNYDDIKKELKPNGGSSLRDAINRIEKDQVEIKQDIRDLREKIDDHVQWHLDHPDLNK